MNRRNEARDRGCWTLPARCAVLGAIGVTLAGALAGQTSTADLDRDQIRDFLRTAAVVEMEPLDVGVTGSRRALLENGDRRHSAHVQTVNVVKRGYPGPRRVYPFFRDSYKYNVAASILDDMLDLGMVPVSVERTVGKHNAAVTWWVDDVMMMERDRILAGTPPQSPLDWADQLAQAKVFSALIANADFNPTNLLITEEWKMWLIDFTRAFRDDDWVELEPNQLPRMDRRLWERLRSLGKSEVNERLGDVLSKREIRSLLSRRDAMVGLYADAIEQRGEPAVICDRPRH